MERLSSARTSLLNVAWKPLAWIGGLIATACAAAVAAVLVAFAGLALRARRTTRRKDAGVIDARHIGGRSWVAYGWDDRGR